MQSSSGTQTAMPDLQSNLLPNHIAYLQKRAVSDEVIAARGYYSVERASWLRSKGLGQLKPENMPALMIPVYSVLGEHEYEQARPDIPRMVKNEAGVEKKNKFENPQGRTAVIDACPLPWVKAAIQDPQKPLMFTEGIVKADAAISKGILCLGLTGVWNWRGRNWAGGLCALGDWEHIPLNGRKVYIVFDSDVMEKRAVYLALERFVRFLLSRKAEPVLIYLPPAPDGGKQGLDDFFARGGTSNELFNYATNQIRKPEWFTSLDSDPETVDLPVINTAIRNLAVHIDQAWDAVRQYNSPEPRLYSFQNTLIAEIKPRTGDKAPAIEVMNEDRLSERMARIAKWCKIEETGFKPAYPEMRVVKGMLATPHNELPMLEAIVETPIYAPDGTLHDIPGYNPASRCYYDPPSGFTLHEIPDRPTQENIAEARSILDEVLGDFPFVSEADKAHAVAAMMLPFARSLIDGPTPFHLIDKPTPGSGGSLLGEVISAITLGRPAPMLGEGHSDEDWGKKLTAVLMDSPSIIMIDNIKNMLASNEFAKALTARTWQDRLLGASKTVTIPVRNLWIGTGNNVMMTDEINRRTIRARIDPGVAQPEERTDFKHPNLLEWVKENRNALVWAILTLIRAGQAANFARPESAPILGMYENWSRVIGGILHAANIPGFLGNRQDQREQSSPDTHTWAALTGAWNEKYGVGLYSAVKSGTLVDLIETEEIDMYLGKSPDKGARAGFLGHELDKRRDRIFGGYKLCRAPGKNARSWLYYLEQVRPPERDQKAEQPGAQAVPPVYESVANEGREGREGNQVNAEKNENMSTNPQEPPATSHFVDMSNNATAQGQKPSETSRPSFGTYTRRVVFREAVRHGFTHNEATTLADTIAAESPDKGLTISPSVPIPGKRPRPIWDSKARTLHFAYDDSPPPPPPGPRPAGKVHNLKDEGNIWNKMIRL